MVLMVSFSSRISPFTSTVILRDKSPRATAVATSAMLRTCAGQVAGHEVHVVGQVLPGARHAGHLGLTAQLAFGAHFAGHAGHFAGERVQLVHHRVDGVLEFENFALHVHGDLARQVAAGHGRGHFGDVSDLAGRLPAIEFTESVKSFHVPATPGTLA